MLVDANAAPGPVGDTGTARLRAYLDGCREEIVTAYTCTLRAEGNPLGEQSDEELARVVLPLIDVVVRPDAAHDTAADGIGRSRAQAQMNPVHSLHAASYLYDCTAEVVVRGATALGTPVDIVAEVLRQVHGAILRRVGEAAIPYASVLLQQISDAHIAERLRIARELHDRSAHALALAFQQLEIRRIHVQRGDVDSAETCLDALRQQLNDAADLIRDIASDLGSNHTRRGLGPALREYVETHGEGRVTLRADERTGLAAVPSWVSEQAYLSIREAIRNALVHSGADEVSVLVGVRHGNLVAVVRDTGVGMPAAQHGPEASPLPRSTSSGTGLRAMTERIEQFGGSVVISSEAGRGTTVELVVPLP